MNPRNILSNLAQLQAEKYKTRTAISEAPCASANTPGYSLSWNEFSERINYLSYALETLGIQPRNAVAFFASNCVEAVLVDFACFRNRAIPVSIYSTSSPDQVAHIILDSGARLVFVGDQTHYDTFRSISERCPEVYKAVVINPEVKIEPDDHMSLSFDELLDVGRNATDLSRKAVEKRTNEATPEDIATLIYTSGTTGTPKGAVLPHSCFNAVVDFHKRRLSYLTDCDTSVCFLPLAHIFEKAWTFVCLCIGMEVTINRDPREIQDTLRLVRPTAMCSVPRFWEKVYSAIQSKLDRVGWFKKWLMSQAMKCGRVRNLHYRRLDKKVPFFTELKYKFFYNQIFHPMQKVAGVDRGVIFPTAGAPLAPEITEYLISCGIPIVIGYGLSETTATVSCFPTYGYKIGTIGTVLEGVDVKISDDGEILVKGPTVMRGYYGRPLETAQAFTPDGWFRTGDGGYFDDEKNLVLTDRIKDLFKTSNGKYVAPQMIESKLLTDPVFEQIALIGDRKKFVSALIVPDKNLVCEYAESLGLTEMDYPDLLRERRIHDWIGGKVSELCKDFARHERIKKFTLLPEPFKIENGELTNTLKIRRKIVLEHFAEHIDRMYDE